MTVPGNPFALPFPVAMKPIYPTQNNALSQSLRKGQPSSQIVGMTRITCAIGCEKAKSVPAFRRAKTVKHSIGILKSSTKHATLWSAVLIASRTGDHCHCELSDALKLSWLPLTLLLSSFGTYESTP